MAGPEVVGLGAAGLRASAHKASASRDVGASRGLKQEAREEAGVMAPQTETARGRELGCAVAEGGGLMPGRDGEIHSQGSSLSTLCPPPLPQTITVAFSPHIPCSLVSKSSQILKISLRDKSHSSPCFLKIFQWSLRPPKAWSPHYLSDLCSWYPPALACLLCPSIHSSGTQLQGLCTRHFPALDFFPQVAL